LKEITGEMLKAIMPNLPAVKRAAYLQPLNEAMREYDITNEARAAAFLANLAEESRELNVFTENLNYTASGLLKTFKHYFTPALAASYAHQPERIANRVYANRLGNGDEASGDGWRYRGRSPIQLTGRKAYRTTGRDLGLPLEAQPELAAEPEVAFRIAAHYFATNGLNSLADARRFKEIVHRINGGYNGLDARVAYYNRALRVLPDDFRMTANAPAPHADAVPDILDNVEDDEAESAHADIDRQTDAAPQPDANLAVAPKTSPDVPRAPATPQAPVVVPQAQPASDPPPTDVLNSLKAKHVAIPAGVTLYLSAVWAWIKSAPSHLIVALIVATAVIVTTYIVLNILLKDRREKRDTMLKLQREQQAHELTVLQANSAKSRTDNTVVIVPQPLANSDAPNN
jgi:putative chitinase